MADRACLLAATLLLAVFGLLAWFTAQFSIAVVCTMAAIFAAGLSTLFRDRNCG